MVPSFAHASDPAPLVGRAEVNWRYGSERSILMSEFWVPFLQDGESVLYGDARLMGDDQDNNEFNLGLGYREIVDAPLLGRGVAGVHGWFDRRITARGSTFHQATLGAEWLGEEFDILANTYIPLSDSRQITIANTDAQGAQFIGTGIVIDTDSTIIEDPQAGFDIEFGWQVPFAQEFTDSARLYGGAYYFDGDDSENVAGWRTRLAVDVTSDIQIGGRFQRDDERGSQGFLEATIRFPFGQKKSFRDHGLYARLDDSPERDIDIVTGEKTIDQGDNIQVINNATGAAQEILHVDNTAGAGGDGSADNPFNTLQDAVDEADAHTMIYVHAGTGDDTNQNTGVNLSKVGQQLIGSGVNLYYNTDTFSTQNGASPSSFLIAQKTTAPVISNAGGDGITVTADNVTIAGTDLTNIGDDAIYVDDANNVKIDNVNFSAIVDAGVYAQYNIAETYVLEITNSTFTNMAVGIYGRVANGANLTAAVNSNTIDDADTHGIQFGAIDTSAINLTISDNTVTPGGAGAGYGILVSSTDDAQISSLISDNTVDQSGDEGIRVNATADSRQTTIIRGNTSSNADDGGTAGGILVYANTDAHITADIIDNTSFSNKSAGIWVFTQGNSTLTAKLQDNTSYDNGQYGFYINNASTGTMIADMGGGTLGSTGGNSSYNNLPREIFLDLNDTELKAQNNWWGSASGLDIATDSTSVGTSSIDASNPLTSAP